MAKPSPKKAGSARKATASAAAKKSRSRRASAQSAGTTADLPAAKRGSVKIYRQGLGDCMLVRIKRKHGDDFKLMIDCGVVLGTIDPGPLMTSVVDNIVEDTGKRVDVLAITHEHWDHLSGFTQAKESFDGFSAGEVWVAWTEDRRDDLANELKDELGKAEKALTKGVDALNQMKQPDMADLLSDLAATGFGIATAGANSTQAAFDVAKGMAKGKTPRFCRPTDEPFEIPGANARIYVLGPPHDPKLIRRINPSKRNPETYALALNGMGVLPLGVAQALSVADDGGNGAPFHPLVSVPLSDAKEIPFFHDNYFSSDDWRRIDGDWLAPANGLALALQSYTNNTSLVLAIELGAAGRGDVLLFAADAQVGNWESWQDLKWPENAPKVSGPDLLARTVFYKVGHHGSHNATLKQNGLEAMAALQTAVIPVDEAVAKKKHWGSMPLPKLLQVLTKKIGAGNTLRTDRTPTNPPKNVHVEKGNKNAPGYFEISF